MRRRRRYEPNDRPRPGRREVTIHTRLEPYQDSWRWEATYWFDGLPSPCGYAEGGTFRHPTPDTVQGLARTQSDAHAELAIAVDTMRRRIVAAKVEWDHRQARGISEQIRP